MDPVAVGGLFLAAFLAATVIPAQSEALLVALLAQGRHAAWLLVGVASLGNVLGSIVNWWLGRGLEQFKGRRWFPVSEAALAKAQARYARYGRWSLLLSWVPIIGDPITVVAGVMRERLWVFTLLVGLAKTLRYVVLAEAYLRLG
jgi:membrane protein YqaA with SNARE-associated domain